MPNELIVKRQEASSRVKHFSHRKTLISQQANVLKTLDNFTIETWYSPWASILKVFDKPGSRIEDSVSRDGHVILEW